MDGVRVVRPDRTQLLLQPCCLEELLPDDHPARVIWAVVEHLDLSAFYAEIAALTDSAGRPAIDPRLLVALWLYATQQGIGSGRELARLCTEHDAYRWLCGGLAINYHTLNDFRVAHDAALDQLMTQVLTALVHQGLVRVECIAQDGTRVRAAAGRSSFRRKDTLLRLRDEIAGHVRRVKQDLDAPARERREGTRRATAKLARVNAALDTIEELSAAKARQKNKPSKHTAPRASTTDPEARWMRLGDGGFGPAYNIQTAVDVDSRAIVGVAVTNAGSDANESEPMRRQVEARTGGRVRTHLLDGGYKNLDAVERAEAAGVRIFMPPPVPKSAAPPGARRPGDGPGVVRWRRRMAQPASDKTYRLRASTAETVHADLKTHRGLHRLAVRGLRKIRCVALWAALTYNVLHFGSYLSG